MRRIIFQNLGSVILAAFLAAPAGGAALEMSAGGTVVFLGDTLIERAQEYGELESVFTSSFPDADLKFRNLGWSADTVRGQSRGGFDHLQPMPGWNQLLNSLREADPDWVILGYGMAESFGGGAHVEPFAAGLQKLVDEIRGISPDKPVRFVFLSPLAHEWIAGPLPDPEPHNRQLKLFVEAIQRIATENDSPFVNLYQWMMDYRGPEKLTDNGIHLNAVGYRHAARFIGESLDLPAVTQPLLIDRISEPVNRVSLVSGHQKVMAGSGLLDENLNYVLRINGEAVHAAPGSEWIRGVNIEAGPVAERARMLAERIIAKNRLFFYRWRPQNNTYLFLFRKHEQGQNAREIPMFDPLIEEEESSIHQLAAPGTWSFSLEPFTGAATGVLMDPPAPVGITGSEDHSFDKPTQEIPRFEVSDGFEIQLFASNPLLAKPIHMNFDADGRLWVASSEVYPQIEPGQKANDKIIVIEDTDGDGVADNSRVFADGLLIPTGVAPGDGGVYVGHSTELLHLKDTDGDGIADRRRIVLSGFGTEDTHHILHSLRWGPDGMLYMNQSIYIHTHMETPHGVVRLNSGGIIHLQPATMKAGVYVRGFCNPWGHHFDPWGQSFVTDGAGYQGLSLAVPGAMYFTYAGAPRIIDSISPGSYPKFCGLELIQSPLFPADWQGDAITCDFRAHKIVRFSMEERDSAFLTTQQPDLVTTDDVTFRPIDVKFGPDGALYIADWSNPIIQHGEVDFRDPRRDHVNGRIWRVVPKGVHAARAPRLTTRTNRELLDGLNSPVGFVRENSRRVLLERGSAILPDLQDWVTSSRDDRSHLEALWLYQGLNLVEPQLLSSLINSDDHRIRAAAVRAVHHWKHELPASFQWKQSISDSHPRVRMEALRALAVDGTAADMEDALSVLDHPMDKYLEYALWLTVNDLRDPWVTAVEDGAVNPSGLNPDKLAYALKALPPEYAGRVLGRALAGTDIPADGSGPWLDIIGQAGTPAEIEKVSAGLSSGKFNEQGIVAAIRSLDEAARSRRLRPSNTQGRLTAFLQSRSPGIRAAAITLAGAWKDIGADFAVLARIPTDTDHPAQERVAAVEALRQIGGAGSIRALEKAAAASDSSPEVRLAAATALATLDTETAWPVVSELMKTNLSDAQILGLWRSLLQVKGAGGKLEPWVRVASIPARAAELGVRAAGEGGRQLPGLVIALNQAGQLEGRGSLSPDDFEFLARQVRENGDPHRGEAVYRRSELACTTCHAIGGIGGVLGPDMTSIGASAPLDYLIESLYFPNAKIKEGYHAVNIDTIAELTYSGTLVREDASRIWLRDAASNIVEVPKDQIVSRVTADYSLMPSGLIRNLGTRDQVDLFAFLSSLGKAGDFDASRPDKARRWFLYPATIDAAQFGEEKILGTDLGDNASWRGGWKPFDSLVNGRLPKSSLQQRLNEVASRFPNKLYAGALFEAAGQGTVEFSLSGFSHPEAAAWIDGKEVPLRDNGRALSVSLQPGRHTIILRLPADELPDSIALGSPQVTFVTQ